jgi:hypothetical protein
MDRQQRHIDSPSQRQLPHVPVINTWWSHPITYSSVAVSRLDLQLAWQTVAFMRVSTATCHKKR